MSNDPQVLNHLVYSELQSKVGTHSGNAAPPKAVPARTTMAVVLMAAAIAALAVTSLVRTDQPAAANAPVTTASAPSTASLPVQTFAFGYLEFEDFLSGGVPGVVVPPPRSQAQ